MDIEKTNFINRFIEIFGSSEPSEISRVLEISHQEAKNYLNGRLPDASALLKISEKTSYSIHWLLTGKGEKFNTLENEEIDEQELLLRMRSVVKAGAIRAMKETFNIQNAYFYSLNLENLRCFSKKQTMKFSSINGIPKQWTIILGNNGTGKTTILQSLVAMIPNDENYPMSFRIPNYATNKTSYDLRNWIPFRYKKPEDVGDYKNKSEISICFSIKEDLSKTNKNFTKNLEFSKIIFSNTLSEQFWDETEPLDKILNITCFAYGATRKAGETSLTDQNEESRFKTLFDENALLLNPEEWILQADYFVSRMSGRKSKENFNRVKKILVDVLPDVNDIKISERNDKEKSFRFPVVEFHTPYGWVEAKDLSLGYRTSMAWIVDFASRMFDLYPESENPLAEPAVVLIDEIDLHLHPKWQRELLDYLSNLFPNTQFIVTTHSPLIVQSAVARDANIVVCRREGDHVVIDQSVEAVRNWRADQILTSDLFGLETARPKEIEPLLEEREKILSKAKLTKKDEKRLTELEDEIGVMPVSENPEDDKAMDIIRRAAERFESRNKQFSNYDFNHQDRKAAENFRRTRQEKNR